MMEPYRLRAMLRLTALTMALTITASCADNTIGGLPPEKLFNQKNEAALIDALMANDYDAAQNLVAHGTDVNAMGREGITPLEWLLAKHNLNSAEWLLQQGADPNVKDSKGRSAMYYATGGKYPDYLVLLLKYKGNPDLLGPLDEPMLSVAISSEANMEMVKLLIQNGANVNQPNNDDSSVADKAVALGNYELVAYLLDNGLSYKLKELSWPIQGTVVPDESEASTWKRVVIKKLEAKGIEMPCIPRFPESCRK